MKKRRTGRSLGPFGNNVDSLDGGELLGHRKADKMIDGNAVRIGGLLEVAVQRIRKSKAQCAHGRRRRKVDGLTMEIPNWDAGMKSL